MNKLNKSKIKIGEMLTKSLSFALYFTFVFWGYLLLGDFLLWIITILWINQKIKK